MGKKLTFASFNFTGLNEERVNSIQSDLLASESIDILCLQETWLVRSQMPVEHYT